MDVCAILLSYKRPQNMQRIVDEITKVPEVSRIVLSNNNPEIDIRDWVDDRGRVEVINQPTRMLYTKRFEIAHKLGYPYYFCPDDDVFLSAQQIRLLLRKLEERPEIPHGMYGQIGAYRGGQFLLAPGVHGVTCEVDVLNRAYFFTLQHMNRVMELAEALGYADINDAIYMEDVLLSHSGRGRPICHDIGPIQDCPTSDLEGVATYKEDGFPEVRDSGYRSLRAQVGWRR